MLSYFRHLLDSRNGFREEHDHWGLLAAPCADAFVAPGASHAVTSLRGSTPVKAESSFGTHSAVTSFVGTKKPTPHKTVACKFSPEAQIGVTEPLGFLDPAVFCKDEASFKDLRAKELKHGRTFVLAGEAFLEVLFSTDAGTYIIARQ